ncbi:MAG: carbohydrate kinase [Spirochaetales bacterium]|nr:carbohydrate kinase [Spirochaetales bacterium]
MSAKVLAFGEILWDMIEGEGTIGGASLNFASHFRQLGGASAMISAVGQDSFGDRALDFLNQHGVKTSFISRSDKATGEVPVILKDGIPSYNILEDRAWDYIPVTGDLLSEIKKTNWDIFYFGSLAQRTPENRAAVKSILEAVPFKHIFLDINLRQNYYSKDILIDSMTAATILKLNDEEIEVVSRMVFGGEFKESEVCEKIMTQFDIPLIVVTLGSEGARLYGGGEVITLHPPKVNAVDTVGAGDSFSAAFVYSYTLHGDLKKAGELALKVAAHVVTHTGAVQPYPEGLIG